MKGSRFNLTIPIGYDNMGNLIEMPLEQCGSNSHVLIEGCPGSGKTSLLHWIISTAIQKYSTEELEVLLVDRGSGFQVYQTSNFSGVRAVYSGQTAVFSDCLLEELENEYIARFNLFKYYGVPSIFEYRKKTKSSEIENKLPEILVIIDDFKWIIEASSLADKIRKFFCFGRALGIHFIIAGQWTVLPSWMEDKMKTRIALCGSKNILDHTHDEIITHLKLGQAIYTTDPLYRKENTKMIELFRCTSIHHFQNAS